MDNKHLWKVLSKLQKTLKKNRKSERKKYLNSCTDEIIDFMFFKNCVQSLLRSNYH